MIRKMPYLIAVILICIAPMADTYVLIPAMTDIGKALPDASLTQLNLILTIPSLFVIPASLLAGKLVEWGTISKKNCLLLGFTLFTLGGASGGLYVDIYYLLATRAVLGIGNGLATAMVVTITADYFTEKEGATVMGLYSAIGGLIAIGLTVVSGYLVVINWRLAFVVYLVCLLVILYHAVVLKQTDPKPAEDSRVEGRAGKNDQPLRMKASRVPLGRAVWVLIAITILSQTVGNSLYLALSHFIEGEGLGDASATGIANGVLTAAIVLISLVFSGVYAKIGKHTALLFFVLMAVGFFFLGRAHTFNLALASLTIWGLGYGLTIPYVMQEAIVCPPRQLITFTGSLVNSCIFLSFVLSTFVQPLVAALSGREEIRFFFAAISFVLVGCGFLSVFMIQTLRKPAAEDCKSVVGG